MALAQIFQQRPSDRALARSIVSYPATRGTAVVVLPESDDVAEPIAVTATRALGRRIRMRLAA